MSRCLPKASRPLRRSRCAADCDKDTRCGPDRTAPLRPTSRRTVSATICCARMSSAFCGISMRSRSPLRIAVDQRRAFDQFIARGREENAARLGADPVAGTPDALQRDRNRARRADLNRQIHRADIDAEFERCRRDDGPQFAVLQPRSRRRAAGCATDCRDAAERHCGPSRAASACATRSDSRRVLTNTSVVRSREDVACQAIVDLLPHLAGGDRAEFVVGDLDRQDPCRAGGRRRRCCVSRRERMRQLLRSGRTVAERPMRCGACAARSRRPAGPA